MFSGGDMDFLPPSYRGKAAHERWRMMRGCAAFFGVASSFYLGVNFGSGDSWWRCPHTPCQEALRPLDSHASLIIFQCCCPGRCVLSTLLTEYHHEEYAI